MTLTEKLQRLTDTQNVSALAAKAGISRTPLIRAIAGAGRPTLATAAAIASALNVDAGWFMDDTKEWPPVYVEHQSAVA